MIAGKKINHRRVTSFVDKTQRDTEYYIARKKGKLSGHLKKWAAFNI